MLKTYILQTLNRIEGHGISVTTLRTELEMIRRVKCGEMELRAAITELSDAGLLTSKEDDMTSDILWSLTPAGSARARH